MNPMLDILTEFLVLLESRARRYGLDLTQVDMTLYIQPLHNGWEITSFKPNHLVRIR